MVEKQIRVAYYLRQSIREEQGIENQKAACTAHVNYKNIVSSDETWIPPEADGPLVFEDNDVSATKARGPETAWGRMFAAHERGEFDVVLATRLDRLLRRMEDYLTLSDAGIPVVLLDGEIDTLSKNGKLYIQILTAVAEFEIAMKKERAIPYALDRRKKGHPAPGKPPYGYSWIPAKDRDDDQTRWMINEEEAAAIRTASDALLIDKKKIGEICRLLDLEGYKTRGGGKWARSTVRHILLSPFVAGLLPPGQPHKTNERGKTVTYDEKSIKPNECVPGAWEEILSRAQWEHAQIVLFDEKRLKNSGQTARKHLLGGLAICGVCGDFIRSAWSREKHRAYRCINGHFLRRADSIDEYVVNRSLVPMLYDLEARAGNLTARTEASTVDTSALNARKAVLLDQQERLYMDFVIKNMSPSKIDEMQIAISDELQQIDRELASAFDKNPIAELIDVAKSSTWEESVNARMDLLRLRFDTLGLAKQRAILTALFTPIVFPVGKGYRVGKGNIGVPANVGFAWVDGDKPLPLKSGFPLDQSAWTLQPSVALSDGKDIEISNLYG